LAVDSVSLSGPPTKAAARCDHIVAKWRAALYRPQATPSSWLKIKNREYSQARDRAELLSDKFFGATWN
jgi:hypothetical protein